MGNEKSDVNTYESFRLFVMSILGRTEGTAASYVSYVKGVCAIVGKDAESIVSSVETMKEAIFQIEQTPKADGTKRNYVSGIKAYWRFAHGREYEGCVTSSMHDHADIAFEIRQQVNDLELRACDKDAAFWSRIMDVATIVLTVIPTLLTIGGLKPKVVLILVVSLVFGVVGLAFLMPILRRPVRQSNDLYEYGKKLLTGQVSGLDYSPEEKTGYERFCESLVAMVLPISIVLIFIAIMVTVID